MNNSDVRVRLSPLPHPYPDDRSCAGELWGEIVITADAVVLLRWQWDIGAFAEWYMYNRTFLRQEELGILQEDRVFRPLKGESLARALRRLQSQDFPEGQEELEDAWLQQLFTYRQRHSLRFALRGADIPDIVIGPNSGSHEISLSEERDNWVYRFDLDVCMRSLERDLTVFLPRST